MCHVQKSTSAKKFLPYQSGSPCNGNGNGWNANTIGLISTIPISGRSDHHQDSLFEDLTTKLQGFLCKELSRPTHLENESQWLECFGWIQGAIHDDPFIDT